MMPRCKAPGCKEEIARRFCFCPRHWGMLPTALQVEVWKHYRRGQEYGLRLMSEEYLKATQACVDWLRVKLGMPAKARAVRSDS